MATFWTEQTAVYLKSREDKRKDEVDKAKESAAKKGTAARTPRAPKGEVPTTKRAHKTVPAYGEDEEAEEEGGDVCHDDDNDDVQPRPKRPCKRMNVQRVRSVSAPPKGMRRMKRTQKDTRSDQDSDMDDEELVREGKKLTAIRDMDKVYPLLNKRSKTAVRKGLINMVSGSFREHLTPEEKKKMASHKRDYNKVCSRRKQRNPFEGKRKHVGETYQKFMADVNLVQDVLVQ